MTLKELGLVPLTAEQRKALEEYEREMDKAIPEIIEAVEKRQRLADEARRRY